jgi:hypothetical protein
MGWTVQRAMVFAILVVTLLIAQIEDLATASHMMGRLGTVAERGPLAGTAYEVYGLNGLISLKVGLFALVVGSAVLLVRVGRPLLVSLAVALLVAGSAAGIIGAASNLHAVGLV